jgi:hypothetical protein
MLNSYSGIPDYEKGCVYECSEKPAEGAAAPVETSVSPVGIFFFVFIKESVVLMRICICRQLHSNNQKQIKMENNKKQMIENEKREIEQFFEKPKDEIDQGELSDYKLRYKLHRTIGIDLIELYKEDNGLCKVAEYCKGYIKRNRNKTQWLIMKSEMGIALVEEERVELAKYHVAICYVLMFD